MPEFFNYFKNRNEQVSQEIVSEAEQLTRSIQPYFDKMGNSIQESTILENEEPIENTEIRQIHIRKQAGGERLLCCFLHSVDSIAPGDLQVVMSFQPRTGGGNGPLSFETIETFKYQPKKNEYWLPLKPTDQLKKLRLANKTFRSGTE